MSDQFELPPDTKLTRTKQGWAREGKFLTGETADPATQRLPPGQHLTKDWPVLDLGVTPSISPDEWRLEITGAVDHPIAWDWPQFRSQPQTQFTSDIHCVTAWSRYDNDWEGVAIRELVALCRPRPDATHVLLRSYDGYTTYLALEDFVTDDSLLAHSWSGVPLEEIHGGPVRLVVPHLYFWKSAKWLRGIEFVTQEPDRCYWETRGYHRRGDPWAEQRYSTAMWAAWRIFMDKAAELKNRILPG